MQPLLPCKCGAPAVEQIRGEMGPGDYWQDRQEPGLSWPFGNVMVVDGEKKRVPFHTLVETSDTMKDDIRISCSKCDQATEWARSYKRSLDDWNARCAI